MSTASYPARTEQNVIDSDGTLIIARGKLTGGTDLTRKMTLKHKKQLLGIDLNLTSHFDAASLIASWIKLQKVQVLNVAGPRASKDRQIYSDVVIILEQVIKILTGEENKPKQGRSAKLPKTVDEAVDRLIEELSLKDKTTLSNFSEDELINLHINLGAYIRNEFGLWFGNEDLMASCCKIAEMDKIHEDTASSIIIERLWERLKKTHRLRVVR